MFNFILLAAISMDVASLEERLAKYDQKCQEQRDQRLTSLREMIAFATQAPVTTKARTDVEQTGMNFRFRTAEAKRKHVKLLQELLSRQVEDGKTQKRDAPLDLEKMEVGDIGLLPDTLNQFETEVRVFQVSGPSEMIVELRETYGERGPYKQKMHHFWVSNVPTAGLVDNKTIKLGQLFDVVGTKTYMTVAGANRTIYKLSPILSK